jgi:hypothetical protein
MTCPDLGVHGTASQIDTVFEATSQVERLETSGTHIN